MSSIITDVEGVFERMKPAEQEMLDHDFGFYTSLKEYYTDNGCLSDSQLFHLERLIFKYNPIRIAEEKEFVKNYSDRHRETALQIAKYYDAQFPRYYGNIVDIVLEDPADHTLTASQWNKMCENKYAKKIRKAYDEPEKFSAGDVVQIRQNNRIDIANDGKNRRSRFKEANKTGMVLEANARAITRPAKGARIYKILLTDDTSPIYAHESDLKIARRKKK